jgi:hypothetical protein
MAGGKYIRPFVAVLIATQLQQGDANQPPHAGRQIANSRCWA